MSAIARELRVSVDKLYIDAHAKAKTHDEKTRVLRQWDDYKLTIAKMTGCLISSADLATPEAEVASC